MHADEDKVLSGAPEHVLAIWHVLGTQHCEHATDACGATHPDDLNRAASLWKVHVQVAICKAIVPGAPGKAGIGILIAAHVQQASICQANLRIQAWLVV